MTLDSATKDFAFGSGTTKSPRIQGRDSFLTQQFGNAKGSLGSLFSTTPSKFCASQLMSSRSYGYPNLAREDQKLTPQTPQTPLKTA